MAEYQLTLTDSVIRESDGACIPSNPNNRDRAAYDAWLSSGGVPDPYVPPAPAPQTLLSQDLMAQFTAEDAVAIRTAVANDPTGQTFLLWSSLQAQTDPMVVTNARFKAGWSALVQVLGQARMADLAIALGITVN